MRKTRIFIFKEKKYWKKNWQHNQENTNKRTRSQLIREIRIETKSTYFSTKDWILQWKCNSHKYLWKFVKHKLYRLSTSWKQCITAEESPSPRKENNRYVVQNDIKNVNCVHSSRTLYLVRECSPSLVPVEQLQNWQSQHEESDEIIK